MHMNTLDDKSLCVAYISEIDAGTGGAGRQGGGLLKKSVATCRC